MTVTRLENGVLDWRTRCRTWTIGRLTVPITDVAITAFFTFATVISFTFPFEYGWSLSYSLNALLHCALTAAQLFRRVRARTSLVTTGLLLAGYAVLVATSPVNLGFSLIMITAPCSVFAATRWIPHWGWGASALTASLIGSLANPVAVSGYTTSQDQAADGIPRWYVTAVIAAVVVITVTYTVAVQLRARAEHQEAQIHAAVSADRLRISRELHDLVGHGLTAVKIQAQTAKAIGTSEAAAQALDAVITASSTSLDDVRSMVAWLRDEETAPLVADPAHIGTLIEQTRNSGITLTTSTPSREELNNQTLSWPLNTRLVFIRVITEALTNIVRHSTGTATLTVTIADGTCAITTTNPYESSPTPPASESPVPAGHGLTGIGERVQELGGTLNHRITGRQFVLDVRFPVPPTSEEAP